MGYFCLRIAYEFHPSYHSTNTPTLAIRFFSEKYVIKKKKNEKEEQGQTQSNLGQVICMLEI